MINIQLNLVKVILSSTGLFLLVVGCQQTVASERNTTVSVTKEVAEEQTEVSPSATSIVSTRTLSPTSTSTPIPSPTDPLTPQPTLESLPIEVTSPTLIPIETIMPTPLPTLPPNEAANKVLSLLTDNQNPDCLLPCWWGVTPGQTNWQDIEPFLNSIAIKIRKTPLGASVTLPLPDSVIVPGFDYNVVYIWDELGIVNEIDIDRINISGYDPKTMMVLYGVPDEVWLTTISEPREGVLPFQLIIVYQEQGISFRYYVDAVREEDLVTACFEPGVVEMERPDLFPAGPRIYLWEPGEHKGIKEISPIPLEIYFPLEEKTDLTPETLYEKFTSPNELPCIDTPAEFWRF